MKRIYKYAFVATLSLGVSFSVTSCKGFLDTEPSTAVTSDQAITDYSGAVTALMGAYDAIQGNSDATSYYGADFVFMPDVQGDLIQATQQGMRSSQLYEMRYTESDAPVIWARPYLVIARSNNVIAALEAGKVTDATPEEINNIIGQAKFLRALAHFDLCRANSLPYTVDAQSMGIPIITSPMSASDVLVIDSKRGTVADVYDFVIAELIEAAALIADDAKTPGFANSWAAKAILSRVYLYKGDNANALATAKDVIDNSPYALMTNAEYPVSWSDEASDPEAIFEIISIDNSDWVDREALGYLYDDEGYADMIATPKLVDYFTANPDDVRGTMLASSTVEQVTGAAGDAKVVVKKYPGKSGDSRLANINVIRLSEVYLNAAEAAQKLGQGADADAYVNAIASRNPGKSYSGATLDEILWERGVELFAEGHRKFDLTRNGKEINRMPNYNYILIKESESFDANYFRAILPIPLSEINANPTLKDQQNPGY